MICVATILTSTSLILGVASWETHKERSGTIDPDLPDEEAIVLAFFSACFAFGALGVWMEVFK